MSEVPIGNAVVCEHISGGMGDKPTLIGVLSGNITVPAFPASMWIAVYVEVALAGPRRLTGMSIEVEVNGEHIAALELEDSTLPEGSTAGVLSIPSGFLTIQEQGSFAFWIRLDGFDRTLVTRREVILSRVAKADQE